MSEKAAGVWAGPGDSRPDIQGQVGRLSSHRVVIEEWVDSSGTAEKEQQGKSAWCPLTLPPFLNP
jgi:hypothetical protein